MEKKYILTPLMAFIIFFLLIAGCTQSQSATSQKEQFPQSINNNYEQGSSGISKTTLSSYESSDLWEYFPMNTGTEWTYNIKIENVQPVIAETIWMIGKENYYITERDVIKINSGENARLRIKVKGPEQETHRPGTVELEILEDDLGLFRYVKQIFWARKLNPPGAFGGVTGLDLVIDYSADQLMKTYTTLSQQLQDATSIHSSRVIFFGNQDMAMIEKDIGDDKIETLTYSGLDSNVPGYQGIPCLHFSRQVYPPVNHPEIETITEDSWYAKGKGLVRFEQKVGNQPSMTWTLEKYTPT